ncbi:hypothetical protein LDENG_00176510 [Lucifuga dentata]|nr:hypothetical protein LDENG_00176510 [Lucifuga dentata]
MQVSVERASLMSLIMLQHHFLNVQQQARQQAHQRKTGGLLQIPKELFGFLPKKCCTIITVLKRFVSQWT